MSGNESYGDYDFSVWEYWPSAHIMKPQGYCYTIYRKGTSRIVTESKEWFDSDGEARLAAIGHISLIQQGVDYD